MIPLQPEMPKVPLADQSWFVDLLAAKGFFRSSPTTFTNGKASIQADGTKFLVDPGTGDKAWNSDLAEADPGTIKLMIQQILKTRPFLTETDLADERVENQRIERALMGIAATIKEGPDTGGGVQLRRFLWVPESVQRDEFRPLRSADDVMAHRYRLFAVENSCRHEGAMFGAQMCSTGYSRTRLIPVKHDGTRYRRL